MNSILKSFDLIPSEFSVEQIGTGHIHQTYKLKGKTSFILQRVNKNVFKQPEIIASNLRIASDYLKDHFPQYSFLRAVPSPDGSEMIYDEEGFPWRLFPYQENTITIDKVSNAEESYKAAEGFARLTRYLDKIEVDKFSETIPRFHDLSLRYQQFQDALANASIDRKQKADKFIDRCHSSYHLIETYEKLITGGSLCKRIVHNDTKINNILFDSQTKEVACVIDLDTLMPGYFIYDLGDMVRTFVSPVSEEESDYSKIVFRKEIYEALLKGYLSQLKDVLTEEEKVAIPFAGKMMTFIMALRFLADYLNGDIYYHTTYPGQNLVRAGNQLEFLEKLEEAV
ncbi:MAG: aminoglycoside phosphotransferase family protein [Bacteroidota bacterium]